MLEAQKPQKTISMNRKSLTCLCRSEAAASRRQVVNHKSELRSWFSRLGVIAALGIGSGIVLANPETAQAQTQAAETPLNKAKLRAGKPFMFYPQTPDVKKEVMQTFLERYGQGLTLAVVEANFDFVIDPQKNNIGQTVIHVTLKQGGQPAQPARVQTTPSLPPVPEAKKPTENPLDKAKLRAGKPFMFYPQTPDVKKEVMQTFLERYGQGLTLAVVEANFDFVIDPQKNNIGQTVVTPQIKQETPKPAETPKVKKEPPKEKEIEFNGVADKTEAQKKGIAQAAQTEGITDLKKFEENYKILSIEKKGKKWVIKYRLKTEQELQNQLAESTYRDTRKKEDKITITTPENEIEAEAGDIGPIKPLLIRFLKDLGASTYTYSRISLEFSGKIEIEFTVDEQGNVATVTTTGPANYPTSLKGTIEKKVKLWKFPKNMGGTYSAPLIFQKGL